MSKIILICMCVKTINISLLFFTLHNVDLAHVSRSLPARFIILILLYNLTICRGSLSFFTPLLFTTNKDAVVWSTFVPNKARAVVTKKRLLYTRLVPDDAPEQMCVI